MYFYLTFVNRTEDLVSVWQALCLWRYTQSINPQTKNHGCRRYVPKDTTPTIFAFGEFYCFAVIFGLRRVVFATRVQEANRISLQGEAPAISLLRQQKYHAVEDSISLKTIRKSALTHHPRRQQKQKRADMEINPYRLFNGHLAPDGNEGDFFSLIH